MSLGFTGDRRRIHDRRKSPRIGTSGRVRISISDPVRANVEAELVESSEVGFRISHGSKELVPGVVVEYSASQASGRARVIWTHVLEGRHVSGFMIVPK